MFSNHQILIFKHYFVIIFVKNWTNWQDGHCQFVSKQSWGVFFLNHNFFPDRRVIQQIKNSCKCKKKESDFKFKTKYFDYLSTIEKENLD